jgi:mono/diheme cytochrome c family protein
MSKIKLSGQKFLDDVKGAILLAFALLISFALLPSDAGAKGDAKRGKKIFGDLQCSICHADGGNNLNPEAPLKGPGFLKKYPLSDNKALEKLIRTGIPARGMPANGKDKLSDPDLQDLISYIRSLTPAEQSKAKK